MFLFIFLLVAVIGEPLQSATVYFRYKNNTKFKSSDDICIPSKSIDDYTLCQKCSLSDSEYSFEVAGKHGNLVFMELYTLDPTSKPFKALARYGYTFYSYHLINARLDKFHEDYLLSSSSTDFTDASVNKTGNFVHLSLVLGFHMS
jgi:hypothetical protein